MKSSVWDDPKYERFLKENIDKMTAKEIAEKLGLTLSQIKNRKHKINLSVDPSIAKKRKKRNQFKAGHSPHNKGVKGLRYSPASEFKKGNLPYNTLYDGAVRVRLHKRTGLSYKWIRLSKGKWQQLHQKIWLDAGREIPRGHVLKFINGDSLDVRLDNLVCLDRKDQIKTNLDSDGFMAHLIAGKDGVLKKELMKQPALLNLKREQRNLKRAIKNGSKIKKQA